MPYRINIPALRAFRRVAELRSFSRAAQSLEITDGAVSKLISQLERELGARLLSRSTRHVTVTEAGASFYEHAVRALEELDAAVESARSLTTAPRGTLRASVPTSFALQWLAPRLPEFLELQPQINVDLVLNDRFVDLVEEGFDCALRIATTLPDSTLIARPLGRIERVVVAAPGYLKRSPALHQPSDLARHNCLLYSLSDTPHRWPLETPQGMAQVEVSGTLRVNNSVMLRDLLLAGVGLALVPRFVVDDLLADGRLVKVLTAHPPHGHVLFGVRPAGRQTPRKVSALFDFIARAFGTRS